MRQRAVVAAGLTALGLLVALLLTVWWSDDGVGWLPVVAVIAVGIVVFAYQTWLSKRT